MIASVSASIGAIYIFLLIGVLISSWLMSGTIPTLLYIAIFQSFLEVLFMPLYLLLRVL